MANITTTELSNSIPTIVAAEALGYLKANTVLAMLVARDWEDEVAQDGQTVDVPFTGSLSVNDKTENSTVTLQTPSDTKKSITLNNHKEVSFIIEDLGRAFARPDYLMHYMEDGMKVMAEELDGDIAALYSGFSQSIDGTTAIGEDDFRNGRRLLNAANAPLSDRFAVLHEDAEYELLGIERFVNRDYAELQGAPQGLLNAYSGRFMGFGVYMDQKIATATSEAKNLLFQKYAIGLATRPLDNAPDGMGVIQRSMAEEGIGVRVTMGYNKDYLGYQVTIDLLYGVAEIRDNHGVVLRSAEI